MLFLETNCIIINRDSRFISTISIYCGTWERIADGRFFVGVDLDDDEFGGYDWIGGEREVTLSYNELPNHGHQWIIGEQQASLLGYGTTVITIGRD